MSKKNKTNTPIHQLPTELSTQIFSYLSLSELGCLAQVSQTMKAMAENNHVWFDVYKKKHPETLFYHANTHYKNRYALHHFLPLHEKLMKSVIANTIEEAIGCYSKRASFIFLFDKLLNASLSHFSQFSVSGLLGALLFEGANMHRDCGDRPPLFKFQPSYMIWNLIKPYLPKDNQHENLFAFRKLVEQLPADIFTMTCWQHKETLLSEINSHINLNLLKEMNGADYDHTPRAFYT